jgi:hypothetical protein
MQMVSGVKYRIKYDTGNGIMTVIVYTVPW